MDCAVLDVGADRKIGGRHGVQSQVSGFKLQVGKSGFWFLAVRPFGFRGLIASKKPFHPTRTTPKALSIVALTRSLGMTILFSSASQRSAVKEVLWASVVNRAFYPRQKQVNCIARTLGKSIQHGNGEENGPPGGGASDRHRSQVNKDQT